MKKKKYKKATKLKMVKEPQVNYTASAKQVMIFKSFEEADEYHYGQLALLSPQEHLSNAVKWIKRLYQQDLKRNPELGTNFRIG